MLKRVGSVEVASTLPHSGTPPCNYSAPYRPLAGLLLRPRAFLVPENSLMPSPLSAIEEKVGNIFVDGQRCEVWVRSEPDDNGTWHNALLFRRDGRVAGKEVLVTGVEWHVPPGIARQRGVDLPEKDQIELFQRALRPRPPL